jgi:hypothetical protein
VEAIRYGDQPEVRSRLSRVVDEALDRDHLRGLLEQHAIGADSLSLLRVRQIREEMERAQAARLQPHYISSFFLEAFRQLGGSVREREPRRWEISHVPSLIRSRDRQIGTGVPLLARYERITFDKEIVSVPGRPLADFVSPGHPLLEAVSDLILERHRELLKRGAVLVAPDDDGSNPRVLVYLEHSVLDGRPLPDGGRRTVSREMHFVEIDSTGWIRNAGCAPYLDYRPLHADEMELVPELLGSEWLRTDLEARPLQHAIEHLVPAHFERIRRRKEDLVDRTLRAVRDRLTKEISYWDARAEDLRVKEAAGRATNMNWQKARQRADELEERLQRRTRELVEERRVTPLPPVIIGGALVVPAGMLTRFVGKTPATQPDAAARRAVERRAMDAVFALEQSLGYLPVDVSAYIRGWDIESRVSETAPLRLIEVKGRAAGAETVTVTRNEVLRAINAQERFILALVEVDGMDAQVRYVRQPFVREPDFGVTSVNYDLSELSARSYDPLTPTEVSA